MSSLKANKSETNNFNEFFISTKLNYFNSSFRFDSFDNAMLPNVENAMLPNVSNEYFFLNGWFNDLLIIKPVDTTLLIIL